jgi:hypothetical protein
MSHEAFTTIHRTIARARGEDHLSHAAGAGRVRSPLPPEGRRRLLRGAEVLEGTMGLRGRVPPHRRARGIGGLEIYPFIADWLRDELDGRHPRDLNKIVLVPQKRGMGPYEAPVESLNLPRRAVPKKDL